MNNITDKDLEDLEVQEVFDADELEKELNDILNDDYDNPDDLEAFLVKKNAKRKQKSVLLARRRKRQLRRMSIIAAVICVVLVFVTVGIFVVLMKDATSTLSSNNTDVLSDAGPGDTVNAKDDKGGAGILGGIEEDETAAVLIGEYETEAFTIPESEQYQETKTQNSVETEPMSTKAPETVKPVQPVETEPVVQPTQGTSSDAKYVTITASNITAGHVALYDVSAGKLIAGKGPYDKMYPASMTKLMTLIVACENITNWNATSYLTQAEYDKLYIEGASMAGYEPKDVGVATDLLYGLVLKSGCDAAVLLAKITSGTEAEFVKLMNNKCKELGLTNTHFANASGLHDDNQYTTAADMCKIMEYAMKKALCSKVLGTYSYTTKDGTRSWVHNNLKTYKTTIYESNRYAMTCLNNSGFTVLGAKSGYTSEAGNCLATCVEKSGRRYILVVGEVKGKGQSTINSTRTFLNYIK